MSDRKVYVTGKDLRILADHAKAAGTEARWIDLALEWIDYADAEIERLKHEHLLEEGHNLWRTRPK